MHLKRIHIAGFKSFADRVTLNFDTGITGIVGPNGSGKSNVIDAVRWVMGEQNAKNLRGAVATDIIFGGSERRKALGMAEVTLTFENSGDLSICPPEYRHESEISLTRHIYQDGEREYFINKKPARLKDILDFFTMTGLGGRSYSIIQQGQVDRILNAKPEDLREVIEEAAGTLIYKTRKAEAFRKLETTRANLARVEDLLGELHRQKDALKDQVAQAQKWQELRDRLRTEEMSYLGHDYQHFKEKLTELQEVVANEATKEVASTAALAHYEARQLELQLQLESADPELESMQEEVSTIREQIARHEGSIANATSRIQMGEKRQGDSETEALEDSENLKVLETQLDAAALELSTAEKEALRLREEIENFQSEVDGVDESSHVFQNRLEELDDEIRSLEKLIESNGLKAESARRDAQKNKRELDEQAQRFETIQQETSELKVREEAMKSDASGQKAGLDKEISERQAREGALAQRLIALKKAQIERDQTRERYLDVRARHSSLGEMLETLGDIRADVQKLRQDERASSLLKGMLTDFIAFKDEASELSRRGVSAFERWADRLVVQSVDDLNALVRLCHELELGALPVTVMDMWSHHGDQAQIDAWAEKHDAEKFSPYIKITKKLDGLPELLGNTFHISALALEKSSIEQIPAGILVFSSQGISVTGPSDFLVGSKVQKGVLSRTGELTSLANELKELEKQLAKTQSLVDTLETEQNEDRQIISEIDARMQKENKEVLQFMSELQAVRQQLEHKTELMRQSEARLAELRSHEAEFEADLEELRAGKASLEQEKKHIQRDRDELKEEYSSIEERRSDVFQRHQSRQVELAKSEARSQAIQASFNQTKFQLERIQTKLNRRYQESAQLQQDVERAKVEIVESQGAIEGLVLRREHLEREISVRREASSGIIEELRVVENRLRECRETQAQTQKLLSDKNMAIERCRIAIEGLVTQAQEKYQLDLSIYEFERDPDFQSASKSRSVQQLRAKLEAMGPVNQMAIKEFNELTSRVDFIESQRAEIGSSIAVLEGAISEIEETSKDKFFATFTTVNTEIGRLFPTLFPGGEAHLALVTPEDVLNSGVEIYVRLPGKARQRMNLFSGGEKALTAISLIFALLRTKPTPFCFLDEVDAPLDEANVGRFNNLIEALAEQFQFIIITHNRRTMEVLDTLYGVTMQEPGVSSILGVDMRKDLPPHLQKAFKEKDKDKERAVQGATAAP